MLRRPSAAVTVLPVTDMPMAKYIQKSKQRVLSDHQNRVTDLTTPSGGGCSVISPVESQVPNRRSGRSSAISTYVAIL